MGIPKGKAWDLKTGKMGIDRTLISPIERNKFGQLSIQKNLVRNLRKWPLKGLLFNEANIPKKALQLVLLIGLGALPLLHVFLLGAARKGRNPTQPPFIQHGTKKGIFLFLSVLSEPF